MKKLIFVSVPMANRDDFDIVKDIDDAVNDYLHEHDGDGNEYMFVDNRTFVLPKYATLGVNPNRVPLLYLGHALEKMAACDDVIFAGDWEKARGCSVEKLAYDLYFND